MQSNPTNIHVKFGSDVFFMSSSKINNQECFGFSIKGGTVRSKDTCTIILKEKGADDDIAKALIKNGQCVISITEHEGQTYYQTASVPV